MFIATRQGQSRAKVPAETRIPVWVPIRTFKRMCSRRW